MAVPYTFGNATGNVSLVYLDSNFSTPITLGATAIYLGDTVTLPNASLTNSNVTIGSTTVALGNTSTSLLINTNDGLGYSTGAGGTVTQATNKATGVTLNKICGTITCNAASLAAATTASFTLTNSALDAQDVMILNQTAGTTGSYLLNANVSAGSAVISIRNVTAAALAEAVGIRFVVIKAVNA